MGYVSFGFSSDRFGRRPSFSIFASCKAVGMVLLTLGWAFSSGHAALLYSVAFLVGFGEGNWGCMGPLLAELFPTHVRAGALGIIYNFSRGVQFIAPVVVARVAAARSFSEGIALAGAFATMSAIFIWALPETKGKNLAAERATRHVEDGSLSASRVASESP